MSKHGIRTTYVAGCRCDPCRQANTDYGRTWDRRRRRQSYGIETIEPRFADTTEAREHLLWLSANGVGRRTIANATGLSSTTIGEIFRGRQHATQRTVDLILAVGLHRAPAASRINAAPSWRLVDDLLYLGFTKVRIAREMGRNAPALRLGRDKILKTSAESIRRAWEQLIRETAAWHGTYAGYTKRRCRCIRCRDTAREFARRRREAA